jgi:hypothetical protein
MKKGPEGPFLFGGKPRGLLTLESDQRTTAICVRTPPL